MVNVIHCIKFGRKLWETLPWMELELQSIEMKIPADNWWNGEEVTQWWHTDTAEWLWLCFTIVKYVPHQERSSVTAFWILCVCTVEAKVVRCSWRDLHLEWRTLKQSHSRCKSHKIFYGILKVLAVSKFHCMG